MSKTYTVFESLWQVNPFVTLETGRDWSDLDCLASELSAEAEPEDEPEITEEPAEAPLQRQRVA